MKKPPEVGPRKPRKRSKARSCGKRRYRDHSEAISALRSITYGDRGGIDGQKPIRAYPCDRCGGWHVSSHERWGR